MARGARQLVVQEALETMMSLMGSYLVWLTPITYLNAGGVRTGSVWVQGAHARTAPYVRCRCV